MIADEPSQLATTSGVKAIPLRRRVAYLASINLLFILLLAAVELGVRVFLPPLASLDLFVNSSQQKAQVADAKQSSIFEGDPLLLWRLKPNLKDAVWDFTVLSTNEQSFRSDYPIGPKTPGTFRIVCLGDSVTFGYRVPSVWPDKPHEYDRNWLPYPMLLERQLREANPDKQIQVIAMAVPGYSSHQGLAWLTRDISKLDPDLVTVSFGWNDVSLSDAADRQTITTNTMAVWTRWLIDHSQAFAHATKWLRSRRQSTGPAPRPLPRVSEAEYVHNMMEIVRLAQANGSSTIVIAAPYRDRVTNASEAELMTKYRRALRAEVMRNQITYLEIRELTEDAYPINEGWFGELIHPNHMGHRLMASELLKLMAAGNQLRGPKIPSLTP